MNKTLKLIKNCWPYTLFSAIALFVFGIRYFWLLQVGIAIMFVAYYFALQFVKAKIEGNKPVLTFLSNVAICYTFSFIPFIIWLIRGMLV